MKTLIKLFSLAVLVTAMTGCFKPETAAEDSTIGKLVGYWEVVHVSDYDITTNLNLGSESVFDRSSIITPNDGNEEYSVLQFTETVVILRATDCSESISDLDIPLPYQVSGNKLYCLCFSDPETNLKYAEIENLTEDTLVLFLDEQYTDENSSHHDTRRITFNKIH